MSITREMDKEDVVHIYNGVLLSHKKEWNNAICSNMDRPKYYHTKWSQRKTNISLINRIFEKLYKWTYLQNSNRFTDFEIYVYWRGNVAEGII